jgi:hypothetical protein
MTTVAPEAWVSPVVAVGVTGHRSLADEGKLRSAVEMVLRLVREAAEQALAAENGAQAAETFTLRIVSPVAEGADRLVAQAGLDLGAKLQCPLPLPRDDYAHDFQTPESKAVFYDLLAKAERVFEMDAAGDRDGAYLDAGRLVLSQSDILIAIWDGKQAKGRGGTAEIVSEALARRLPIVWLKPDLSEPPVVITGSIGHLVHHEIESLNKTVGGLVTPPPSEDPEEGHGVKWSTDARIFLKDKRHLPLLAGGFNAFVNIVLTRPFWRRAKADHWLSESLDYWSAPFNGHDHLHAPCQPCLDERVSTPFARADALATHYAGLYRTTYLVNFALSASAVSVAMFGLSESKFPAWGELICIAAIIGLTTLANWRHYHERWVDYRHLAEQIRPLRYLFPLGLALPQAYTPRYMDRGQGSGSWAEWLVRRVERELGLPDVAITPTYLNAVHDFATDAILEEQIGYHRRNQGKLAKVDHRLHLLGLGLFGLSAIACLVHLLEPAGESTPGLFELSGILPAWGAAVLGIRNIGEFARLELRSKGMQAALEETRAVMTRPPEEDQKRPVLSAHLEALAAQMMSETADWRTLVITRHIELPS